MQRTLQNFDSTTPNRSHAKLSLIHGGAGSGDAGVRLPPTHQRTTSLRANAIENVLTLSEKAVLEFAARGLQNGEIAQRRGVSIGTIKAQMHRIFEKLGTHSRYEAALLYKVALSNDANDPSAADDGEMDFSWLSEVALTAERWRAGHVLFRQGDAGDKLYYITQGEVSLLEKPDTVMGPRTLFGEIAAFAPGHRRTFSAQCKTEVDVLTMTHDQVQRCFRLYPQFAIYILSSTIRRLMADRAGQLSPCV